MREDRSTGVLTRQGNFKGTKPDAYTLEGGQVISLPERERPPEGHSNNAETRPTDFSRLSPIPPTPVFLWMKDVEISCRWTSVSIMKSHPVSL